MTYTYTHNIYIYTHNMYIYIYTHTDIYIYTYMYIVDKHIVCIYIVCKNDHVAILKYTHSSITFYKMNLMNLTS